MSVCSLAVTCLVSSTRTASATMSFLLMRRQGTAGNFLLEAACAAGWHGLLTRSFGPQIRGGAAAALIRLAQDPVECAPDHFDLLIAIDWLNAGRFEAEIPLGPQSLVVGDPEGGAVPPGIAAS